MTDTSETNSPLIEPGIVAKLEEARADGAILVQRIMEMGREGDERNQEIERLEAVVADQALTIGTVRDENGRLFDESVHAQGVVSNLYSLLAEERKQVAELKDANGKLTSAHHSMHQELQRVQQLVEGFELERDHAHHLLSEERRLTAATADEIRNLRGLLRQTLAQHDNGHSPCNCVEIRAAVCP